MTSFVGMFYRTIWLIFPLKNQTKPSGPQALVQKCLLCNTSLILDGNLIFHFAELSYFFVCLFIILLSFPNYVHDSTAYGIIHVSNLKGPKISTDPTNTFHSWQFIPLETIISCMGLCLQLLKNTLPWPLDHYLAFPFLQPGLPCPDSSNDKMKGQFL